MADEKLVNLIIFYAGRGAALAPRAAHRPRRLQLLQDWRAMPNLQAEWRASCLMIGRSE
jgi:hypothetical protein